VAEVAQQPPEDLDVAEALGVGLENIPRVHEPDREADGIAFGWEQHEITLTSSVAYTSYATDE
jgi:hypothetical protein